MLAYRMASKAITLALTSARSDAQKIATASTFLRGSAQGWWQQNAATLGVGSWDQFGTAFLAYFQPVNASSTARTKLINLRQRGGTNGFNAYRDQFNKLLADIHPPMGEAEKLGYFQNGLMPETKKHVMLHDPATCIKAMELAARVEEASKHTWRSVHDNQRRQPHRGNRYDYNINHAGPAVPSDNTGGAVPMELGMHIQPPEFNAINKSEKRFPKSFPSPHITCGLCGGKGHIMRRCPHLKSSSAFAREQARQAQQ